MTGINLKVGFIGAGAMAEALIRGLIKAGANPGDILASDVNLERLTLVHEQFGVRVKEANAWVFERSDIVILAVKPQNLAEVLSGLTLNNVGNRTLPLVISIAAGMPVAFIEKQLPPQVPVIRAMPNTPGMIGYGATALTLGTCARMEHEAQAKSIFEAIGVVFTVPENQMDAVTGLSGSGPAYGYLIIEALADAGVCVGLPRPIALGLAAQTMAGAAHMVKETGLHPGALKDQVTSPGGTTIAGLYALEEGGLRSTLMRAVFAATTRSKELRG